MEERGDIARERFRARSKRGNRAAAAETGGGSDGVRGREKGGSGRVSRNGIRFVKAPYHREFTGEAERRGCGGGSRPSCE